MENTGHSSAGVQLSGAVPEGGTVLALGWFEGLHRALNPKADLTKAFKDIVPVSGAVVMPESSSSRVQDSQRVCGLGVEKKWTSTITGS